MGGVAEANKVFGEAVTGKVVVDEAMVGQAAVGRLADNAGLVSSRSMLAVGGQSGDGSDN